MRCCLCGNVIRDYGNNPYPLMVNDDDRCCDSCNMEYVIPARLGNIGTLYTKEELAKITTNIRAENEAENE